MRNLLAWLGLLAAICLVTLVDWRCESAVHNASRPLTRPSGHPPDCPCGMCNHVDARPNWADRYPGIEPVAPPLPKKR